MPKLNDLTGRKFGRLTVTGRSGIRGGRRVFWLCECDCGKSKSINGENLARGLTQSCGCIRREALVSRNTKHGMTGKGLYWLWAGMIARCEHKGHTAFYRYGGRGISVCERWHAFTNFVADMGPRPSGASIERVDNDRGYEPGNCRWATSTEQARNKRTNVVIEYDGRSMCLAAWAKELGIEPSTLSYRVRSGWGGGDALSKPKYARRTG